MAARAKAFFYDLEAKTNRNIGDEWECGEERIAALSALGLVEKVEKTQKPKRTRRARAKKEG